MPTPEQILGNLAFEATSARGIALLWHLAAVIGLTVLFTSSWRPRTFIAQMLAVAPLVTVSSLASTFGLGFNAVVTGAVAFALVIIGARGTEAPVAPSPLWSVLLGLASVSYALVYPHFVPIESARDLWFTPVGVVPCPSFALVIGAGLLAGGFGSRAWSLLAGGAGLFYAVFGIAVLHVWLDAGLLLSAGALVAIGVLGDKIAPSNHRFGVPPAAASGSR
ncbi:MAG: hypothetical protein QM723_14745 [Myxococcaceae bacterium]